MKNVQNRPLIFDICRGSIDDGPGIRTIVFFKGCPLNCIWCHNPESIDYNAEIGFYAEQCIGCGECKAVCPNGAIDFKLSGRIDKTLCKSCGRCAEICPAAAVKKIGKFYTVHELVEYLTLDKDFYKVSGGGVTFSGGEPLLHMNYLAEVMKKLKQKDIHIAVQTSGFFDLALFKQKVMHYIDTLFYDIKFVDSNLHQKYTGRDNRSIINNFIDLVKEKSIQVIPRLPLIPGITTVSENLLAAADFIRESGCTYYVLLPYNPTGITKRLSIQKEIAPEIPKSLPDEQQEKYWRELFENRFKSY